MPLGKDDLDGIDDVYHTFYWFGPVHQLQLVDERRRPRRRQHERLLRPDGGHRQRRPYRSLPGHRENFRVLKDLEERNLLVPVVGNFGGPKALRAVGKYCGNTARRWSAFYLSNVEQYLTQDGIWGSLLRERRDDAARRREHVHPARRQGGGGGRGGLMTYSARCSPKRKSCGVGRPPHQGNERPPGAAAGGRPDRLAAGRRPCLGRAGAPPARRLRHRAAALPASLTDDEFWGLIDTFSEPAVFQLRQSALERNRVSVRHSRD